MNRGDFLSSVALAGLGAGCARKKPSAAILLAHLDPHPRGGRADLSHDGVPAPVSRGGSTDGCGAGGR